ncbi:hypothetical protein Sjap_007282 [Stephania japonica]|uniref:Uncharacterized protein n=1 Tax=Stephania japonica TaxID=461633 RepID=A0AAP0P9V7_9MAGN
MQDGDKETLLYDDQRCKSDSDFRVLGDFQFGLFPTPIQPFTEPKALVSTVEIKDEIPSPVHFPSLILAKYADKFKLLNKKESESNYDHDKSSRTVKCSRLSTVDVMKVAGARYVQLFVEEDDEFSMLQHPFGYALSGRSHAEIEDVELAHLLLASVEKIGNRQYERASKLISQCRNKASLTGNPIQRVSYYFAEALQEKLNKETGMPVSLSSSSLSMCSNDGMQDVEVEEKLLTPCAPVLAYFDALPLARTLQYAGMQTIIESMASAKRVHLIDLCVRSGMHLTVLMQALASRPLLPELFKVTAFARDFREKFEETGRRLASFAHTVNLPFEFKILMVSNMEEELNKDSFELDPEEEVIVFSPMFMNYLLVKPDHLDRLMTAIKNHVKPAIMVVTEIEANHNSRSFVTRFIEMLFFYCAFFDSLDASMSRESEERITIEGICDVRIRNILTNEGEGRTSRSVGVDVWRAYFERFGMVETQLSQSCLFQSKLILERFDNGKYCTLDMNGECLIVGWKGTPLYSLSAWKYS